MRYIIEPHLIDTDELHGSHNMRSRGIGNNWVPCFICGHLPHAGRVQNDMACFVDSEELIHIGEKYFHPIGDLMTRAGLHPPSIKVEGSRCQVKFGACGEHLPNLELLNLLMMTSQSDRLQQHVTMAMILRCVPGRKDA